MKIDYNKIFPEDLNQYFTKEELKQAKEYALTKRKWLMSAYSYMAADRKWLSNKAEELMFVNHENRNRSNVEKALIAANIVFDDKKFAEILSAGKFDTDSLKVYISLLNYIKAKKLQGKLDEKDINLNKKINEFTQKLIKHFNMYVGTIIPDILINKISEIISFKPELLDKKVDVIFNRQKETLRKELSRIDKVEYIYYTTNEKDNALSVDCHCVINCDIVYSEDLINLLAIFEKLKNTFISKNIIFNYSINSIESLNHELKENAENLEKANVIYSKDKKEALSIKKIKHIK